jgi:hypothetical protein
VKPVKPFNVYTNNNWYFEIPGLVSPQFHTLEGIGVESSEVFVVDAVTNIKHKFSSFIKDYSDISLTRALDGSIDDANMRQLQSFGLDNGIRVDGNLVKMHAGVEVFRIMFFGMRLKGIGHPTLDTNGADRYDIKYTFSVSEWVEVY